MSERFVGSMVSEERRFNFHISSIVINNFETDQECEKCDNTTSRFDECTKTWYQKRICRFYNHLYLKCAIKAHRESVTLNINAKLLYKGICI